MGTDSNINNFVTFEMNEIVMKNARLSDMKARPVRKTE